LGKWVSKWGRTPVKVRVTCESAKAARIHHEKVSFKPDIGSKSKLILSRYLSACCECEQCSGVPRGGGEGSMALDEEEVRRRRCAVRCSPHLPQFYQ